MGNLTPRQLKRLRRVAVLSGDTALVAVVDRATGIRATDDRRGAPTATQAFVAAQSIDSAGAECHRVWRAHGGFTEKSDPFSVFDALEKSPAWFRWALLGAVIGIAFSVASILVRGVRP